MTWINRIVGHDTVDPKTLTANPNNWRNHPDSQRRTLTAAINHLGWIQQVIVNKTTGHLVDGHARLEEAIANGEAEIPVVYVEMDEETEQKALLTLDPIGAMAGKDNAMLESLAGQIDSMPAELEAMLNMLTREDDDLPPVEDFDMPDEDNYAEQYGLIVTCSDHEHQAEVVSRLTARGYTCKGITV
jgi:hypothetical protein